MDIIILVLYMADNTTIVRKKATKQLTNMTMSYSKHDGRDRAPTYTFLFGALRTPLLQAAGFQAHPEYTAGVSWSLEP